MAVTASIALSPSSVQINQPTQCTLTISNSGGSAVNLINVQPSCILTGGAAATDKTPFSAGKVLTSYGYNTVVPAGGSLAVRYNLCVFEPGTFTVGAIVLTSGNVYSTSSTASLTVTQVDFQDAT